MVPLPKNGILVATLWPNNRQAGSFILYGRLRGKPRFQNRSVSKRGLAISHNPSGKSTSICSYRGWTLMEQNRTANRISVQEKEQRSSSLGPQITFAGPYGR
jgi:hypothetical protein